MLSHENRPWSLAYHNNSILQHRGEAFRYTRFLYPGLMAPSVPARNETSILLQGKGQICRVLTFRYDTNDFLYPINFQRYELD